MSSSTVRTGAGRARGARGRRVLLLVLAVGQLASTALTSLFGGAFTTADRAGEPPIVPAGWTFSIWSLVIALCLAYAVWALPDGRPDPTLRDRLATPLAVVFTGFSVWLVAAEVEPVWLTLVVFVVMLAGLLRAMAVARAHREAIRRWTPLGRALLWGTLGVYTGWSSIAIWLNLTTALAGSGLPVSGPAAVAGQLGILAAATVTAVALLRWTEGLLPYAGAVAWAFVGAVAGAAGAGEPVLAVAAGVGLAVVVAVTAGLRLPVRRDAAALPSTAEETVR